MSEEEQLSVKLQTFHGPDAELRLVDGPRPYLWIGSSRGAYSVLDIDPKLARRVRNLMRDFSRGDDDPST